MPTLLPEGWKRTIVSDDFVRQRVALLQVWKSFEEQRGTADDVAKVDDMMPVQGKRRYVDEETGQLVEGMQSPHA